MKPTQEQIDAALAWNDYDPTSPQLQVTPKQFEELDNSWGNNPSRLTYTSVALEILAAAYRAKCEECDEMQSQLDLADERLAGENW